MTMIIGPGDTFRWPRALALSLLAHLVVAGLPAEWFLAEHGTAPGTRRPGGELEVELVPWGGELQGPVRPEIEAGATRSPAQVVPPTDRELLPASPLGTRAAASAQATAARPGMPSPSGAEADSGVGIEMSATTGTTDGGFGADPGGLPSGFQPPRLLAGALPIDPAEMKELEVPPEIPVRIRVGPDGRVLEIVPLVEPLSPAVLRAIRRSAEAMRFSPARLNGEPVESWFSMTFVHRR